jgi:CheY-like chemotaxis protein
VSDFDSRPILVVDDEPDARGLLGAILNGYGYSVVLAEDCSRALEILVQSVGPAEPRLIVLDLVMPQMSGWEFLAIVKSYYRLSAIPVFIVSGARPHPETLERHTVQGYFPKPVDALALVGRICEVAGRASTVDRTDPDGGPFQGA